MPWLLAPPPAGCGLNPDAVDYNGDTALHDAARFGHTEVIHQLVEHGASTKIRNEMGQTAADLGTENGKDVAEQGLSSRCSIL